MTYLQDMLRSHVADLRAAAPVLRDRGLRKAADEIMTAATLLEAAATAADVSAELAVAGARKACIACKSIFDAYAWGTAFPLCCPSCGEAGSEPPHLVGRSGSWWRAAPVPPPSDAMPEVAGEPSKPVDFDAWVQQDPVARAHTDNSRDLCLIEHGWRGHAAYGVGVALKPDNEGGA